MSGIERHTFAHGEARVQVRGPEDGRPVLMIHGLSYPLEAWGPVASRLASDGNRVVSFDLYGRGESGWDGLPLTTAVQAEQALAVMDHVGFRGGVNVVSLSTSDLIAMWLAAMVPERIRTMALVAPVGVDPRAKRGTVNLTNRPWLRGLGAALLVRRFARRIEAHRARLPADAEPLSVAAFEAAGNSLTLNPAIGRAVLSHMACWPSVREAKDTVDVLRDLRIPTTAVLYGDVTEGLEVLLEGLAHTRRIDVKGGGVYDHLAHPQVTVDALLQHFTGRHRTA